MKNKLIPDALYSGDNGRLLHGRCSGVSAQTTGRDISGQRVVALSAADLAELRAAIGVEPSCESCGKGAGNATRR